MKILAFLLIFVNTIIFALPYGDALSHWEFNTGSGNILYDEAGNNNGTIVDAQWTSGRNGGGALSFDGNGDYVYIPHSWVLNGVSEITLSAWVKVPFAASNIFRERQPIGLYSEGFSVANYSEGTGWYYYGHSEVITNQWYNVTGVFDNGIRSLYINGQLISSVDIGITTLYGIDYNVWGIGARVWDNGSTADQFFTGEIDELAIWDRALTGTEISSVVPENKTVILLSLILLLLLLNRAIVK